jgi:hypothetical protein
MLLHFSEAQKRKDRSQLLRILEGKRLLPHDTHTSLSLDIILMEPNTDERKKLIQDFVDESYETLLAPFYQYHKTIICSPASSSQNESRTSSPPSLFSSNNKRYQNCACMPLGI